MVSSPLTYCEGDIAIALSATKPLSTDTFKWFDAAATFIGTAPTPSTTLPGTSTYYVSAVSVLGCEGPKSSINVVVNPSPAAPIVVSPLDYCVGINALPLTAMGINLKWYTTATGTSAMSTITPSTTAVGATNYYVSQTSWLGCERPRATLTVNVRPAPSVHIIPVGVPAFVYCESDSITIKASATDMVSYQWSKTGSILSGAIFDTLSVSTDGIYQVIVKNTYGCLDTDAISVIQNPLPKASLSPDNVYICDGVTIMLFVNPASLGYKYQWYKDGLALAIDALLSKTPVGEAGSYFVRVTDYYQCTLNTNPISVATYPAIPKPTIIRTGNLLRVSAAFSAYQWYRNAKPIVGANSNTYTMIYDGAYSVLVRNENDCEAISDTLERNALNITSVSNKGLKLTLYPNPTQDKIKLEANRPVSVKVVDATGRAVLTKALCTEVDLVDQADGMYFF